MTGIAFVVNTNRAVPRSVINTSLYSIVTRRTMFGFHKEIENKDFDMMCTKTDLVLFMDKNHAMQVVRVLDTANKNAIILERDLRSIEEKRLVTYGVNHLCTDYQATTESLKPLSIESIPYGYLEKICMLHYFDMLIVYNQKIAEKKQGLVEISIDCFNYKTLEFPNRSIQEMRFRDMML